MMLQSVESDIPSEIFFTFSNKCNMRCGFCYVPFNQAPLDENKIEEIFEYLSSLAPRKIVISGGDPFLYGGLFGVIHKLVSSGHFVHIDSNFKSSPDNIVSETKSVKNKISFGIPIDGACEETHSIMRGEKGHHSLVLSYLKLLTGNGYKCKVNTVVSKINIHDIIRLSHILENHTIYQWSLYQFWPMSRGLKNESTYSLDEEDYLKVVGEIEKNSSLKIGGGAVSTRRDGYFFIRSDGSAYTVSETNSNIYTELGTVLSSYRSPNKCVESDTPPQGHSRAEKA